MSTCLLNPEKRAWPAITIPGWLYLVFPLVLFLAVHLELRLLASPSLQRDDAELLIFNQSLALGYSEQPPLYSWIFYFFSSVFGESLFSLTLFRSLFMAGTILFLYWCARRMFPNRKYWLLCPLTLLLVPMLSWHLLTYLTHSLLLCTFCAATCYCCLRLLAQPRWWEYVLLGLCVGLGGLSKYNFVFFVAALFGAGLTVAPLRQRLIDPRMMLTVLVALLIMLPHGLWMVQHFDMLKAFYRYKSQLEASQIPEIFPGGARELLINFSLIGLPAIGIFFAIFPAAFPTRTTPTSFEQKFYQQWLGRYFVAVVVWHLGFVLWTDSGRLHERWLEPFFVLLPLYLFSLLTSIEIPRWRWRLFTATLMLIAAGLTMARCGQIWLGSAHRGYNTIDSSFVELAEELKRNIPQGAILISADVGIAGNLRMYLQDIPCMTVEHFAYCHPQLMGRKDYVFLWYADGSADISPYISARFQALGFINADPQSRVHYVNLKSIAEGRQEKRLGYLICHVSSAQ